MSQVQGICRDPTGEMGQHFLSRGQAQYTCRSGGEVHWGWHGLRRRKPQQIICDQAQLRVLRIDDLLQLHVEKGKCQQSEAGLL